MKGELLALDFLDNLLGSGGDGVGSSGDSGIDNLGGGLDGLLDSSSASAAFLELLLPQALAATIIATMATDTNTFFIADKIYNIHWLKNTFPAAKLHRIPDISKNFLKKL